MNTHPEITPLFSNSHQRHLVISLITARLTDTQDWSAAAQRTCIYQYDDLGNRVSHKQGAASLQAYFHDKANRLTSWAGRAQAYDLAGNVTMAYSASGSDSYKYHYDHHNRLTGVYDSTDTTRKAAPQARCVFPFPTLVRESFLARGHAGFPSRVSICSATLVSSTVANHAKT